ncbi:MAG: hypothetical protein HQK55_11685, partial [Deltaproteobacteria bacterium]|nr:hypothetical protein [Deltaproteobacteria bacterium]
MSPTELDINKLLDDFNLGLVMVDPEDLVALGEILEKIEQLNESFSILKFSPAITLLTALKKSVEAIILGEIMDKNFTIDLIGQGAGLLQELFRNLNAGVNAAVDVGSFINRLESVATDKLETIVSLDNIEETGPISGEPSLAQFMIPPVSSSEPMESPIPGTPVSYEVSQDRELFFGFLSES